jgi:hypothetical protein
VLVFDKRRQCGIDIAAPSRTPKNQPTNALSDNMGRAEAVSIRYACLEYPDCCGLGVLETDSRGGPGPPIRRRAGPMSLCLRHSQAATAPEKRTNAPDVTA